MGGAKGAVSKCQTCGGRGVEVFNQQIGPGMIQRIQRNCSQCGGEGEVNKDPCKNCKGKKRVIFSLKLIKQSFEILRFVLMRLSKFILRRVCATARSCCLMKRETNRLDLRFFIN